MSVLYLSSCSFLLLFLPPGYDCQPPQLSVLPSTRQERRVGSNLVLTCRAQVPNLELVRDLHWLDSKGRVVQQDGRVYSELRQDEVTTALFIHRVTEADSGVWECTATYAGVHILTTQVEVVVYMGIVWENAPMEQYLLVGEEGKVVCQVRARPQASVDWVMGGDTLESGDRYIIETDGLLLKNISWSDSGVYTCRARVPQTGELEERDIRLEVLEPPNWIVQPLDTRGTQMEPVVMQCKATGYPDPLYTWLDTQGRDVTHKEGWILDPATGTLSVHSLDREDTGEYYCVAENKAGRIQSSALLSVIIKPQIHELYNSTFPLGSQTGSLSCKASGDPAPQISWRKWSHTVPYVEGTQPGDTRITVSHGSVPSPDYIQGEHWVQSSLLLQGVLRADDGLYECAASNEGGTYYRSAHITVEFPPTFEDQVTDKEWSWDKRPVDLNCIATSIPNSTVSWWYRNIQISPHCKHQHVCDGDSHYTVIGRGPISKLRIIPDSSKHYGTYTCKAENIHGEAFHDIILIEAAPPMELQQVKVVLVRATSILLQILPPTHGNTGTLPVETLAVEYKESRHQWSDARTHYWPVMESSLYVVEGLQPNTKIDLRFAAKNRVGFSRWAAAMQVSTVSRSRPDVPVLTVAESWDGDQGDKGGMVQAQSSRHARISWVLPEDNGLPIDFFLVEWHRVRRGTQPGEAGQNTWVTLGDTRERRIQQPGSVSTVLTSLHPWTVYRISVRAHNELGLSDTASVIVRTGRDPGGDTPHIQHKDEEEESPVHSSVSLSLVLILTGSVCLCGLLLLVLIDLTCWCVRRKGVSYMLCGNKSDCSRIVVKPETSIVRTDGDVRLATVRGGRIVSTVQDRIYDTPEGWALGECLLSTVEEGALTTAQARKGADDKNGERGKEGGGGEEESGKAPPISGHLYEATPDHSILKGGLAKSMSKIDITESTCDKTVPEQERRKLSGREFIGRDTRKTPGSSHKTPVNRERGKRSKVKETGQSLPSLAADLSVLASHYTRPTQSTDHLLHSKPSSDSSTVSTVSDPTSEEEFLGFKKTKDFGDFQVFTDSPHKREGGLHRI